MVEDYAKNGVTGLANISSTLLTLKLSGRLMLINKKLLNLGVNISDVGAIVQMLTMVLKLVNIDLMIQEMK